MDASLLSIPKEFDRDAARASLDLPSGVPLMKKKRLYLLIHVVSNPELENNRAHALITGMTI
ncbi:hypothetical protein GF325_10025 [Candidatus Bathyarchaeota archaeon]|nr:hypothetical protein [Candidatus Bathyarchaeota archaeon]